jgi:protein-tyrosine-phosphatase
MPSVLFVCTANRFRSPLAAAILTKTLDERHDPEISRIIEKGGTWNVGSAGTWATPGQPAIADVLEAAKTFDIDLSSHLSERVNRNLLSEFDLILVMQASQREALLHEFPHLEENIYLLSHVTERGSYDIPDATGSSEEVLEVGIELNELIRRGFRYICVLALALHNKRNRSK